MKRLIPAILVLAVIGTSACKSTKQSTASTDSKTESTTQSAEPQLLASINRTACFGQCPMYKATFMDNGEVLYVGKRFVDQIGTYKGLITGEKIEEIEKMINEYDYFSLDSLYPTPISDFPSCITEVRLNGEYKRVVDRRNPPENLKSFERYLDGVLKTVDWTKVSDETIYDPPKQ